MPRTSQRAPGAAAAASVRPKEYRENEIAEAPPSRLERVGLIVGRSADRRRWVGAPLAREDSARAGLTGARDASGRTWRLPACPIGNGVAVCIDHSQH